jgi:hypothetical protein
LWRRFPQLIENWFGFGNPESVRRRVEIKVDPKGFAAFIASRCASSELSRRVMPGGTMGTFDLRHRVVLR